MKHKVLWIEDGAIGDLADLVGPLIIDGSYNLVIALDATEGIEQIMEAEFEAVIVDIRLPPGDDKKWINIHNAQDKNKNAARLGLHVLRSLLKPEESEVKLSHIPSWIRPEVFGVFTIENENEVERNLNDLNIKIYRQKNRKPSLLTLLELIQDVMKRARASKGVA